jgi:hypothetical protein
LGPRLVGADDLAVEDRVVDAEALRQRGRERVEVAGAIPIARHEPCARTIDFAQRAEAIIFQLEEPVVVECGGATITTSGVILGSAGVAD